MVEVDITNWIFPIIASIGMPLALVAINRFSKTSEGTLTGTIKLEGVQSDVTDLKLAIEKGLDKIENMINEKAHEHRKDLDAIRLDMGRISSTMELHEYRLKELERKRNSAV